VKINQTIVKPQACPQAHKPIRIISKKNLTTVLASLAYACFVVFFPWSEITMHGGWRDFTLYTEYFNMVELSGFERQGIDSILGYALDEALWYKSMNWLTAMTGEAAIALRLVSFFVCMVWGIFLFSRMPVGWALLFLLHPTAIDVIMSGIRNGFGWSLIIIGLGASSFSIKWVMFVLAPFIHTTSLGLLGLVLAAKMVAKRVRSKRTIIIAVIVPGVMLGLALTVGNQVILGALGDRRVGGSYLVGGGSFLQMTFWAILLVTQLGSGKEYIRRNALVIGLLAWYLEMNPFIPWSYRVWGAFIPVIAASIWDLPTAKRKWILYIWLGYLMIGYLYWTKLFKWWYPA
jgi:hypothetical protein